MSNKIYTIGREFGSGGKAVGEALANRLGIKLYDKELLQQAAKDSGFCEEILKITMKTNQQLFILTGHGYILRWKLQFFTVS